MKRKMMWVVTIALMCFGTRVIAQTKIGEMNDVPMWDVSDTATVEKTAHRIAQLIKDLQSNAVAAVKAGKVIPGAHYGDITDGARYKSADCEVTWPSSDPCRVYLENQQVMCTVAVSNGDPAKQSTLIIISTSQKVVEYHSAGKTRPFYLSAANPDLKFFNDGLSALEQTLNNELKKYK